MDIKELRATTGLSQQKFGDIFRIPAANIAMWEQKKSTPPPYVPYMIEQLMKYKGMLPGGEVDGDKNS